jgi:SNF1-activating kinase 1
MGIIHRDIKPDNLIWSEDRSHVKIIDCGISYFNPSIREVPFARWRKQLDSMKDLTLFPPNDLTKLRGTDYFIAPELVNVSDNDPPAAGPSTTSLTSQAAASSGTIPMQSVTGTSIQTASNGSAPHLSPPSNTSAEQLPVPSPPAPSLPISSSHPPITKAIDVWALAVTLYCFLFGKLPFDNPPGSEHFNVNHRRFLLYKEICTTDWVAPGEMGANPPVVTGGRYPNDEFSVIRLLDRMLQKDPRRRITLQDVKASLFFRT